MPAAPDQVRKQRHPRHRVSRPVGLLSPSGVVEEYFLEDISLGGAFVRTPIPAAPGTPVRLRFLQSALPFPGRVVHVLDDARARSKARRTGMGVEFEPLSPAQQAELRRLIDALVDEERRVHAWKWPEEVVDLVAEADFLANAGERAEARRALQEALARVPNDTGLVRRLVALSLVETG